METASVKKKNAKINQEIINITKAPTRVPEFEHGIGKLKLGNVSSISEKSKTKEGLNESIGS
ncbi:hypothetical protein H5410_015979 [Solanum commersonii]|uniref:Uncharacterized protein n=1 Tax=Solanum commersonii TaxID=4109 RepID=A0A9J5ZVQ8_SOLCO|nr:hypothetical protein H5410_015979 [Solanum commersonii]